MCMPDHDDILFSEKYLKAESKIWGAVYLSKDHTYAEYAVAPQSLLAFQVAKLLVATQPPSPFWPKVLSQSSETSLNPSSFSPMRLSGPSPATLLE